MLEEVGETSQFLHKEVAGRKGTPPLLYQGQEGRCEPCLDAPSWDRGLDRSRG